MHIYFSGIGGTGIGPLALIALQGGFQVSGSDKQSSTYVDSLRSQGISITIGQDGHSLETLHKSKPIDWFVYSSALPKENPNHPELACAKKLALKSTKRDEFLNYVLTLKNLQMIAVAGTHGKTTTTAMTVWLLKEIGVPVSYSIGAKLSFGPMGAYDPKSNYFVYEADEYDRNFLSFSPIVAIIPGIGYDHPDTYPTRRDYNEAFATFVHGVEARGGAVYAYDDDLKRIDLLSLTRPLRSELLASSQLVGEVNRKDALLVANAVSDLSGKSVEELLNTLNKFPGLSRRFEKIAENLYSDYAHTPEKIRGALQLAREVAGDSLVVVYEGLHNTRQHFIKEELKDLFGGVMKLYVVPSYRARENESLEDLTPEKLCLLINEPSNREPAKLDSTLKEKILHHCVQDNLVLCFSAGGGGSLDEWLRKEFDQ